MNKMIEVKNLQKSYKTGKAVDGVSFDVYKGEIYWDQTAQEKVRPSICSQVRWDGMGAAYMRTS